jgi:hypothetical protein
MGGVARAGDLVEIQVTVQVPVVQRIDIRDIPQEGQTVLANLQFAMANRCLAPLTVSGATSSPSSVRKGIMVYGCSIPVPQAPFRA